MNQRCLSGLSICPFIDMHNLASHSFIPKCVTIFIKAAYFASITVAVISNLGTYTNTDINLFLTYEDEMETNVTQLDNIISGVKYINGIAASVIYKLVGTICIASVYPFAMPLWYGWQVTKKLFAKYAPQG